LVSLHLSFVPFVVSYFSPVNGYEARSRMQAILSCILLPASCFLLLASGIRSRKKR